jgi:hypothetical protein
MSNNFESEDKAINIPAYQTGAVGSEAEIESVAMDNQVINYYFPVEIVVVGTLPEEEREAIEARIWENLSDALDRLA